MKSLPYANASSYSVCTRLPLRGLNLNSIHELSGSEHIWTIVHSLLCIGADSYRSIYYEAHHIQTCFGQLSEVLTELEKLGLLGQFRG